MILEQMKKLAGKLDNGIWKDSVESISKALSWQKNNFEMRPVLGLGDKPFPCPPDYRDIAKSILRGGTELTKEEKKKYGINANAKVGTSIFEHFTEAGLSGCVPHAQELSLAISAIEVLLANLHDWKQWGERAVAFQVDQDACPDCRKLKGKYDIEKTPIPVLDTHLGCFCLLVIG